MKKAPPPRLPCLTVAARRAHNRWYDKAVQRVVYADGTAGTLMEHSAFDGLTVERSFGFGLAALREGRLPASSPCGSSGSGCS